jgi:putative sterol carrier protein
MKFCSLDFYKKVQEMANSDAQFLDGAKGFTATFTFKVADKPTELPPVFMRFDNGTITEVRETQPAEKTDFSLEGDYSTWEGVNKGEIDGATAIMTRQMRLYGSMGAIMKFGKAFQRLLQLMTAVPVEY